jgi:hypothetical protein
MGQGSAAQTGYQQPMGGQGSAAQTGYQQPMGGQASAAQNAIMKDLDKNGDGKID